MNKRAYVFVYDYTASKWVMEVCSFSYFILTIQPLESHSSDSLLVGTLIPLVGCYLKPVAISL